MAKFALVVTNPSANPAPFPGGQLLFSYDTSGHAQSMAQQMSTLLQVPLTLLQLDTSPQFVANFTAAAQGSALGSQVGTISY